MKTSRSSAGQLRSVWRAIACTVARVFFMRCLNSFQLLALCLLLGGRTEPGIVDGDCRVRGNANRQVLSRLREHARLVVPKERPTDHLAGARDDRDRQIAYDGQMTLRHALVRRVFAVARVGANIVGT
jgi:hypothetical protein